MCKKKADNEIGRREMISILEEVKKTLDGPSDKLSPEAVASCILKIAKATSLSPVVHDLREFVNDVLIIKQCRIDNPYR